MFAVPPDLDAALVAFLKAHSSLSPLHAGRVGHALKDISATALRVANLGGPDTWPWEAVAEFQVESWGGTQQQANELARTVCAAIYDMRGPIDGGYVTVAKPSLRPLWQPDDNGRPRYITQVLIEATTEEP